jgi:photosystem II stability/assembly factor-like uncharacterized protein
VTADGGETWREVTPPVGQVDRIHGAFLDRQTAWLVFGYGGRISKNFHVYFTTDGGRTWDYNQGPPISTEVIGDETWAEFAVRSRQEVWAMARGVYLGAGTHFDERLFRSADGGRTWSALADGSGEDYTGMAFVDPTHGWRTLQTLGAYDPAPPAYEATFDGGLTWQRRELPAPPEVPGLFEQYPACETYQPAVSSEGTLRLLVGCFEEIDRTAPFASYLYTSGDAGATWEVDPLPAPVRAPDWDLTFFDSDAGLLLGREIYKTVDGGESWEHVKTVNWDGQFSFVDPLNGWAVATSGDRLALVRTFDGGRTWEELETKITR